MTQSSPTKQRADLTFRANLKRGRHGWLRLTPAYSVRLVGEVLERSSETALVLDPFSGTGTTGLVCAERGLRCDLLDVNPFLVWLARAKTRNYLATELAEVREAALRIVLAAFADTEEASTRWRPPISNVARWWTPARLQVLSCLYHAITTQPLAAKAGRDLLLLAFCRCLIDWSNAAFNHQSMSFKETSESLFSATESETLLSEYRSRVMAILETATAPLAGIVAVREADARAVPEPTWGLYDLVVTSPPYPNRMSYVRELRPYMYWLGYLEEAREAGELDWAAIGGTWGIATSRVEKWEPSEGDHVPFDSFGDLVGPVRARSKVLGNYVHKYFVDMTKHLHSLRPRVRDGGKIHYIVGNSKYYETVLPVEHILAAMMRDAGFDQVQIVPLRKRNSKKELVEFDVSAVAC